jgi:hypothetical protein
MWDAAHQHRLNRFLRLHAHNVVMDADDELKQALNRLGIDCMGDRDREAKQRAYALAHGAPLRQPLNADDVAFLLVLQSNVTRDSIRALGERIDEVTRSQQQILAELRGMRAGPAGYAITLEDIADLVKRNGHASRGETLDELRALRAAVEQLAQDRRAAPPPSPADGLQTPWTTKARTPKN